MNEPTTTKKRGGPQPGSGRPPKDPDDRVVKCNVSMTKKHHEATEGDRAGMIRRALDLYLSKPGARVVAGSNPVIPTLIVY